MWLTVAVREAKNPGLMAALLYLQAHLDDDLSTPALAAMAGMSPSHFHRTFRAELGETVKQHTLRLRLERAALRLRLEETSIGRLAAELRFGSHAVFTRAFRRRFGLTPSQFRTRGPMAQDEVDAPGAVRPISGWELSQTRVRVLRSMEVAFLRLTGDYAAVDPAVWSRLRMRAAEHGVPHGGLLLGIAHDAPGIAEPERLRFDACLEVPDAVDGMDCQGTPGGPHAVTTHVGAHETLPQAYREIFGRLRRLGGYRIVGLPVLEVYSTPPPADGAVTQTLIAVPVAG